MLFDVTEFRYTQLFLVYIVSVNYWERSVVKLRGNYRFGLLLCSKVSFWSGDAGQASCDLSVRKVWMLSLKTVRPLIRPCRPYILWVQERTQDVLQVFRLSTSVSNLPN